MKCKSLPSSLCVPFLFLQISLEYNALDLSVIHFTAPIDFRDPLLSPDFSSLLGQLVLQQRMSCYWEGADTSQAGRVDSYNFPVVLVGPPSNEAVFMLSPMLAGLDVPIVSFWANGMELANKAEYPLCASAVPSEHALALAVVDFLLDHSLLKIYALVSQGSASSRSTYTAFRSRFLSLLDTMPGVLQERYFSPGMEKSALAPMSAVEGVVLVFAGAREISSLFKAAQGLEVSQSVWVLASAAGIMIDLLPKLAGPKPPAMITFLPDAPYTETWEMAFIEHLRSLTCASPSLRNDWHALAFYEMSLHCRCGEDLLAIKYPMSEPRPSKICDSQAHLAPSDLFRLQKAGPLFAAMEGTLRAINSTLAAHCSTGPSVLRWKHRKSTTDFLQQLRLLEEACVDNKSKSCSTFSESLFSGQAAYSIMNWNSSSRSDDMSAFTQVGVWRQNHTSSGIIATKAIDWGQKHGIGHDTPTVLTCQPACINGSRRERKRSRCWSCVPCNGTWQYQDEAEQDRCKTCAKTERPNDNHTACILLPINSFPRKEFHTGIVVFWCLVTLLLVTTIAVLVWRRHTAVVVTMSYAYSMVQLLTHLTLHSYMLPILLASYPATNPLLCRYLFVKTKAECALIGLGLLMRLNHFQTLLRRLWQRCATLRRLSQNETVAKLLAMVLLTLPMVVFVMVEISVPDAVKVTEEFLEEEIIVHCRSGNTAIVPLEYGYMYGLLLLALIVAWRSHEDAGDFNRRNLVMFTSTGMMFSLTYLIVFGRTHGRAKYTFHLTFSLFITFALWSCLFAPRLYVIVFRPERNKLSYVHRRSNPRELPGPSFQYHIRQLLRRFSTAMGLDDDDYRPRNTRSHNRTSAVEHEPADDYAQFESDACDDAFYSEAEVGDATAEESDQVQAEVPHAVLPLNFDREPESQSSLAEEDRYTTPLRSHMASTTSSMCPSPVVSTALLRSSSADRLPGSGDHACANTACTHSATVDMPGNEVSKRPSWPQHSGAKKTQCRPRAYSSKS